MKPKTRLAHQWGDYVTNRPRLKRAFSDSAISSGIQSKLLDYNISKRREYDEEELVGNDGRHHCDDGSEPSMQEEEDVIPSHNYIDVIPVAKLPDIGQQPVYVHEFAVNYVYI